MQTSTSNLTLRAILFLFLLTHSFIFVFLTVAVVAVLLIRAVQNPTLPDSSLAGFLCFIGERGGLVGLAFGLARTALFFAREAAKC